ncbi:hypothetical protein [Qipengyuania aquimaris]|uniref:hypothetical protein n=1 Tax=Qipengyuania aquimaris TaxID=255984 RepID=UPI001FD389C2|nr:hypothetical protein [Qipengyuania aquimaris]UOR16587.1 hypothetical protein LCM05_05950 [Qipengyuania aquimaris]
MDWEVILKGLGLLIFGALFVWFGIDGWRHRREERINLIEAAILKAGKEDETLPFNRWDRTMAYVQPVLMLIFGPLMILFGVAILSLLGE